ncbi:MAG: ATP-binding protein [Candidatus Aminicenantes bacterium]|nr:ATP-binding protein [Candidatus Aminicenantes bacterium]
MNKEKEIDLDMEKMIKNDPGTLLSELKEKAQNVEINKRKDFENNLLRLAQETTEVEKRSAVYEVLVSLQSIWNQYKPEKGLQEKFHAAFDVKNYKEAEEIYKRLANQGLDYIGTFQTGEGRFTPISSEKEDMILHYSKNSLKLYNLHLEPLASPVELDAMEVIDVFIPFPHQFSGCQEVKAAKTENSPPPIWLLLENEKGHKGVVSVDIESIIREDIDYTDIEIQVKYLDHKMKNVFRLSYFQNHLLLISDNSLYYRKENEECERWYSTGKMETKITVVEPTREALWVGHSNGDVVILKSLQYVGVRSVLKKFSEEIKGIRGVERYVLVFRKNILGIADFAGNPVSKPLKTHCEIIQSVPIENKFILMLLANGMLIARDFNQGNIRWQINIGDIYETLFVFGQYVYCAKSDGQTLMFKIPPFHTMAKEFESKRIYVEKQFLESGPNEPIKYISDFVGRKDLLNEIKEKSNAHFLIYGEPRVGKTSLLNVLRDALSETAGCCVVDMEQLLKETGSYL